MKSKHFTLAMDTNNHTSQFSLFLSEHWKQYKNVL